MMTSGSIEKIAIGLPIVLAFLPLARVLRKRAAEEGARGAHAKPKQSGESDESATTIDRGHAIRLASISIFASIMTLANPHGLVYWTIIGATVVILLWEPVSWLTAYLVRKTNEQDA
ncbi:MAG TPA: hypothetical protein VN695_07090 [Streptosporangiaceae bacterium]|nr:hypothetical protein [Streptosporangiaceae bacterium]